MRKYSVIIFFLCSVLPFSVAAQSSLRDLFLAAESYFLFEEFNEALPLYLRVYRQSPDNDNISYKIGVCYLNNPYEKEKSIYYLEKASQNINPKYKDNNFRETSAPPEVLYFLGNAYRINNELDKARDAYNRFLDILDLKIYDDELVREQLRAVNVAEELMKKPLDLDVDILPGTINSRFSDKNPVVSGNEQHLVYVSRLQFYDAVFYTKKLNGEWGNPRNIIPELGVDGDVYPTSLSWDGNELFVYRRDNFIGNIYSSRREGDIWTPLQKLNDNINTKYWESHASISKDGNSLYFSSNREGGYGGLDIYVSQKMPDGSWGPAVNLGPVVNTRYNDDTPFITEDGEKLFFSSYGHYNMGGYDIFISIKKNDGTWAEPRNLGYPLNTTDDDLFLHPVQNGNYAYYPRYKEDGFGRHDIYRYHIYGPDNPRMYLITGYIDLQDEKTDTSLTVSVLDSKTKNNMVSVIPDEEGTFRFKVPQGTYDILINSEKFHEHMQKLEVTQATPHTGLILPGKIALIPLPPPPDPEILEKLLTLHDTIVEVTSDKTVKLKFDAEKGSTLIINVYNDSVLVKSDTIDAKRRRQTFDFDPLPGTNMVEFTLIDEDGNIVTKKAEVIYKTREEKYADTYRDADTVPDTDPDTDAGTLTAGTSALTDLQAAQEEYLRLELLHQLLAGSAEGDLKTFIENIDLRKEGITTREELISYLHENAEKNGFSVDDINLLLEKSLKESLDLFTSLAEGELKDLLLKLDTEKAGIKTTSDLIDYLLSIAEKTPGISSEAVLHLISEAQKSVETQSLTDLLMLNADGELGKTLENLNLRQEGIKNAEDLINYLLKESENKDYSKNDIFKLIAAVSGKESPDDFIKGLLPFAEGNLKQLLSELNLAEAGITSVEDLLDYLVRMAEQYNYTTEELWDVILKSLLSPDDIAESEKDMDTRTGRKEFKRNVLHTGFVFLFLGLIILFLIWRERKKKKKNEILNETDGH